MVSKSLLGLGLMATAVVAQTDSFVDPETGIEYQYYEHASGITFGVALSDDTTSTDLIGRVTAPITEGYVGVSLGGTMTNSLLVISWPEGDEVVSSLREVESYSNPEPISDAGITIRTIADGTSVDADSFTFTFLCEGCVTDDTRTFLTDAEQTLFGWAYSTTEVVDPTDAESALNMHSDGFGLYSADLASARSADFADWAALAGEIENPENPGNGTSPAPIPAPAPAPEPEEPEEPEVEPPVECSRKAKRGKKALRRHARQFRKARRSN